MSFEANTKRLTWNPVFPAPYESIWSILHKVVVLNRIPLKDLVARIKWTEEEGRRSKISFLTSSWIDFDRFSQLLGVDQGRLKSGTWEEMGIKQREGTSSAIRQCPQCAELSYHSVFFNIDAISHCPLHGSPLTQACLGCDAQSTFGMSSRGAPTGCKRCGLIPSTFARLLEPAQDDSFRQQIGALGNQFVAWWQIVGERFPDRDLLLMDLLRAGEMDRARTGNRGWQLYHAFRSSVGAELDWEFKFAAEPVRFSTFLNHQAEDCSMGSDKTDRLGSCDTAKDGYRSVRRHIYKNYISRHKRCYSALKTLSADEQHMLDGDNVCPVALAYVVWRMGSENFVRVAGLNKRNKTKQSVRLVGLTRYKGLSHDIEVRCTYFSFFGILRYLRLLLGNRNIRIKRYDTYANSLFHFGAEISPATDSMVSRLAVLYPDVSPNADVDVRKCVRGARGRHAIVDASWANLGRPTDYPFDESQRSPDMLFQIRHMNCEITQNGFVYISV